MDNFNDDWILTRFGEKPADAFGAVVPPLVDCRLGSSSGFFIEAYSA